MASTSTNTDAADGVARKEHGINDGSGHRCHDHSYTGIDGDAAKRIESLSTILADRYGVQDARLVRALCALGEGELQLGFEWDCLFMWIRAIFACCINYSWCWRI